jgi:hypothetical protein
MASAENRFRKIEIRMWTDQKFRKLSPMPPSGQSLWFYLLSGPHTGIIPGLSKARRGGIADELAWTLEGFDTAFKEITSQQMAEADWQAGVVWIPNAIKCNPPQSPNVITAWRTAWPLIPECDLKTKALEAMRSIASVWEQAYCDRFSREFGKPSGKPSAKPSRKPSAKAMSNQEQEQEQLAGAGNMEHKTTANGVSDLSRMNPKEKLIPKATGSHSAIPDWIPPEAWNGFMEMRKRVRAPMTHRAVQLVIAALAKLKTNGEDVAAVLDQSTQNSWKGVFPTKRETAVNRFPLQSGLSLVERARRDQENGYQ